MIPLNPGPATSFRNVDLMHQTNYILLRHSGHIWSVKKNSLSVIQIICTQSRVPRPDRRPLAMSLFRWQWWDPSNHPIQIRSKNFHRPCLLRAGRVSSGNETEDISISPLLCGLKIRIQRPIWLPGRIFSQPRAHHFSISADTLWAK